jgi:hypothetical protein
VQLDELYAVLSALKAGTVSAEEAIECLSRSPHWVWVAMEPESKLLLTIDVGERTLALAQRVLHQVALLLAPDCVPLFLSDGYQEYLTAIVTHFGHWVQVPRHQVAGPAPKPRWMPLPELLYAQMVKTVRRRQLVDMKHRVVFGALAAVNQVLRPLGWQINTAWLLLDSRVVDLTMSYNPIFVTVASLKSLFFNGLKISYDSWTPWKPKTPESNKSGAGLPVSLRACRTCTCRQAYFQACPAWFQ